MYNIKDLKTELGFIQDKNILKFTVTVLSNLPDYFWKIPASSTAKYHPKCSLGEGGLIRHTVMAVHIAKELFTIVKFTSKEQDLILSSLFLHDGIKKGDPETKYTKHEHPELIGKFINDDKFANLIDEEDLHIITNSVKRHMGSGGDIQWNKSKYSSVVLETPKSKIESFVHMCDYLASRKCLNLDLEHFNIKGE